MKKTLLLTFIISFVTFSVSSQTEATNIKTHEIGLDALDLAFFRTIDVTYEYIKNPNFGYGLTARYCFDNYEDAFNNEKYGITPFLRYYFFNKQDYGSKGFYAEAFMKFFGGKEYVSYYDYYVGSGRYKDYFEAAFGVGVGLKHVNKSGFVLDLNIGGGRSFEVSNISLEFTGRASILFGYRF